MSTDVNKLSKRRQKTVVKKVEWEANSANPVGITSTLTKCRDLLSLATNSVDIFNEVLGNLESLSKLQANFQSFARRVLDAGMCAWLFVLLYSGPHESTVKLLEELVGAFASGRNLPKGFSIRSSRGKAYLPPEEYELVLKACREAVRLLFFLSGQIIKDPLDSRDPIWILGVKLLENPDIGQAALACNSLLYEIELNPKRMLLFQELNLFVSAFRLRVLSFEKQYLEVKSGKDALESSNKNLQRARAKFRSLLMEITNVDNEDLLDVPLDHYLKEHDSLRIAYDNRSRCQKIKDRTHVKFNVTKGLFDILFGCIRNLGILVARGVSMYTGLSLDSTALLRVEPDVTVPATVESSANLYPIVYGGNSTSHDDNKRQKEAVISLLIHEIPWHTLASLSHLERSVSGTVSLRLIAAIAAKLSDTLQSRLGRWCRRALHDLVQFPRWYPVHEPNIPEATKDVVEEHNPNMVQGLLSVLEDDTEAPPKWRYCKRECSIDTRIATAVVYWCCRGNKSMSRRTTAWEEVVNGVTQRGSKLWKLLLERAESKSEIIENVDEYYERVDPTRAMQEMNKLTMAKAMDDLDADGDSDSDDDSDSDSGSEDNESDKSSTASEESEVDGSNEILHLDESEEDDEAAGVAVEVQHSTIFEDLFNDEYALAILHTTATEIPNFDIPDFDLYKDAKSLCTGTLECARFLHNELYSHIQRLLSTTLEGPADDINQRFNHPLHLISLFVQQDDLNNTVAPILCRLEVCHLERLVQQCTHIRRGVCDVVQQRVAIEILISALGGPKPTFIYPVFAPKHQHTVSNRNSFRVKRGKSDRNDFPELLLYYNLLHNTQFTDCLSELVIRIYDSHRTDFTAMGPSGRCHIALILRLLIVISDIDCNMVMKLLRSSCKEREGRRDKFWGDCTALSKDLLWLAPFTICLELGTFQIISMFKKTAPWKEVLVNEEVYGNSAYRCDLDIVRNYSCLLSVLCSLSPALCSKIGENSTTVALAMLEAIAIKDRFVTQFIFRAAAAIVHHAKVLPAGEKAGNVVTKLVPFDNPATNFRALFIQEGNALDIACEMLLDTYHDIWHMDPPPDTDKPQKTTEEELVPGNVVPMKKKVSRVRDMVQGSRESSGDLYEESSYDDRPFPNLSEFNSSYHVPTIAEENSQVDLENSVNDVVEQEAENHEYLDESNDVKINADETWKESDEVNIHDASHVLPNTSSIIDNNVESDVFASVNLTEPSALVSAGMDPQGNVHLNKSDKDSDDSLSEKSSELQKNDAGSEFKTAADDVSTNEVIMSNEWSSMKKDDRCYGAKSFALYILECIIEMVESRLELQDRIYHKTPGLFQCLYNLLTPKERAEFDMSSSGMVTGDVESHAEDGTHTLTSFNAHMGLIGSTAECIRIVVRRHPKIRALIRDSGCIEGLMDALDMSYAIDDNVLGIFVVSAIEQLILRNIEAWNFIKRGSGMKGLLQLCHMGNSAVRILAATEIISQITPKHDSNIYPITESVLNNSGLHTIIRMLKSGDELVQSASLSLLEALCVNKLACRRAVLMPDFIAELGTLLFSSSLSVVRIACDVMSVLAAEDQFTLQTLVRNMESYMLREMSNPSYSKKSGKKHSSITGRLMDITNGMVSINSCSDVAFRARTPKCPKSTPLKEHHYVTERLPPLFDSDPRLKQELIILSNKAAGLMAAITETEESNWPDGGAPLRNTLTKSGILPTIAGRTTSDPDVMSYKA